MNIIKTSGLVLSVLAGLSLSGCSVTHNVTATTTMNQISNPLSLEQIYKDKYFKAQRSTYFKWLDDGTGYTVLEERGSEKDKKDDAENAKADDEKEHGVKGNDIVFYICNRKLPVVKRRQMVDGIYQ